MSETKMAVILVAGEAKRLRPLTDHLPKCFVDIGGQRILDNTLNALAEYGCKQVRLVVGHHAQLIQDTIPKTYQNMAIDYIENPLYQSTNSMFSLYLGLNGVVESTWIIEGDVFFSSSILNLKSEDNIAWFVDSSVRQLDGAFLKDRGDGTVGSLKIVRDLSELHSSQCKSMGVLHANAEGVQKIMAWLAEGVNENRVNQYYDLIIADHVEEEKIRMVDVAGEKWFEVDTPLDLKAARELFDKK